MELSALLPLAPEIFLSLAGMVLLVWGACAGDKAAGAVVYGTLAALLLAFLAVPFSFYAFPHAGALLGGHVGVDGFALFIKMLLLLSALAALAMSKPYLQHSHINRPEYPVLVLFATLGMLLMVGAQSFLGLYVGLELQSLALYVLAAFRRDHAKSSEAGLKYFVLGALASGLLLYGVSLIYGASGTVLFSVLHQSLAQLGGAPPMGITLGLVLVLAAMAFKISAVPFHMWTPDVYEGAPTPVTAFFAAVPKLAGLALLMKLLYGPFASLAPSSQQMLLVLSVGSILLGAFAAIAQSNLKRLLAYSAIGHIGYILMGLLGGNAAGVEAALLYLLIYLPTTLGAFAVVVSLRQDKGEAGLVDVENISDLAGFSKTHPVVAGVMSLFLFSMIGVPPLAGFFGKLAVLSVAINSGFLWLAVVAVLASVVSAYYYLRVIKVMYFDPPKSDSPTLFEPITHFAPKLVLVLCTLFVLGFSVKANGFMALIHLAVQGLLQP